ncbi:substrate-binding domain-containing protein [Actinomadura rugatobispora]|uniref:Substrate-binding domain-containing protein n=1 Tax=Actinomadura rugatobispora TaxID=1994 RepID=A0ABW1A4U5_9ACTN|nr:substrate-binding and VWA domain-containing protein [Actinomadura rugatobispora]
MSGSEYGRYGGGGRRRWAEVLVPLAGAVTLATLLGIGAYAFASAGAACSGDDTVTLDVAVAPGIEPAMAKAALRFNTDRLPTNVRPGGDAGGEGGRCARAVVRKADPGAMAALLAGRSVPQGTGDRRPDVWIPDSSLWTALAAATPASPGSTPSPSPAPAGGGAVEVTRTSVARSPVVVALPRTLAASLARQGVTAAPSWDNLLNAAGGTAGGAVTKNAVIPPGSVRLLVPDPARVAAGMHALVLTDILLANDPNKDSIFTGIVRTARESTLPTVESQFTRFRPAATGRQPIALASERDVWAFNRTRPAEPAVALYPQEGTLSLDHPFTITTADPGRRAAARRLERAMASEATRADVRELGYRSPDGKAPGSFTAAAGVNPGRPRELPAPKPAAVRQVMQSWSKLSLGIRILTLLDISGTMAEPIAPGITRLQATARTAQGGLSMMSNDTELGVWAFSTELQGDQDWRELVPVGPLGERIGSATRRQAVLSRLGSVRPKTTGDTGLFETLTAAYREMTRTHKAEFGNTVLLFTDGKGNDDPGGPSLERTLADLREITDPGRPVQIVMIGVGRDVDTRELRRIAEVVPGGVYVAESPDQIVKIFLQALSRRIGE